MTTADMRLANAAPGLKIAVLWTRLSGYMNACLRALHDCGAGLFVAYGASRAEAPFDDGAFAWIPQSYRWDSEPREAALAGTLGEFRPDVILACSWHIAAYRKALARSRNAVRVLCMDNQWHGTAKQWAGVLSAPWYLHRICDAVFLPGEPQAIFARKLGFAESRIWRGLYTCDHDAFASVYRSGGQSRDPRAFLCAARLSPEKGIQTLREAYCIYSANAAAPWPLIVAGTGPLRSALESVGGIEVTGFIAPDKLPALFARAGCFVLPSIREPWGIVIHEAAAAGMAVIATSACGAATHLVQDGYNGYLLEPGNAPQLARAMHNFSAATAAERSEMRANSYALSLQYTPRRWACSLLKRAAELILPASGMGASNNEQVQVQQ